MSSSLDVILIARCPAHGLHGARDECFVCGGAVEQVPMVPLTELKPPMVHRELSILRGWRDLPMHWRSRWSLNLWTNRRLRVVLLVCRPDRDRT